MHTEDPIPEIDIFAGPGGLSEGFSRCKERGRRRFNLKLSIEMDKSAHRTLELRSFFRHLEDQSGFCDYYSYLHGEMDRATLFCRNRDAAVAAESEAIKLELSPKNQKTASRHIQRVLESVNNRPWVLIGGPPCQAYSMAGRSRMQSSVKGREEFKTDHRHTLYHEYLYILEHHQPNVFVMENVKGLLSSRLNSKRIFGQIVNDLQDRSYVLFSLVQPSGLLFNSYESALSDFVIESENYGVPQKRHRVIVLGIRRDLLSPHRMYTPPILEKTGPVSISDVLHDLPRLRSGLSQEHDDDGAWVKTVRAIETAPWLSNVNGERCNELRTRIIHTARTICLPNSDRGGRFVPFSDDRPKVRYFPEWYEASGLEGVCNHETRKHFAADLHRYLFASCFAQVYGHTPNLRDFPKGSFPHGLLPEHRNVSNALGHGNFNDRFRVQCEHQPSTTVMSHIAKDGHYYIHYDASQCRSLTVREAARLQTLPDNYFFEGSRTNQYYQVGNAVPPFLARQIAHVVVQILDRLRG